MAAPVKTPEMIEAICAKLAEGQSLRRIAREMETDEANLRYWFNSDPEAFSHSVRARELGCDALADECIDIADDTKAKPEDRRIRIDTRLRLIGKWSQRYGDKLTVDNRQTVKHSYDFSGIQDGDLAELERIVGTARSDGGDQSGEGKAPPRQVH